MKRFLMMFAVLMMLVGTTQILIPSETSSVQAQAAPVKIAIIGDYGSGSNQELRVANLIDTWNVDYITTLGDNVYSADNANGWQALENKIGKFYHEYIYPYKGTHGQGSPTGKNRFFPALGNHDWGDPGVALLNCQSNGSCSGPWLNYFSLPGNERYYDVRRGDLHLFVIDDYYLDPHGNKPDSTQGKWLKNSLAASNAQWKIVVNHFPPYSSNGGGTPRMRWPFKEWGVDAVFSGHHHIYERFQVDGLQYFVNGLSGAGRGGLSPTTRPGSQKRYNADNGAIRLTATSSQMKIEFVNTYGTVIDSVTQYAGGDGGGGNPQLEGDVFDPSGFVGKGPQDAARPTTQLYWPQANARPSGDININGGAYHKYGVRHVEIIVRNSDTKQYWNPITGRWQNEYFRFAVFASPRGWSNIKWNYTIPANKIANGNYNVRAFARSWTGSGDRNGSGVVPFTVVG